MRTTSLLSTLATVTAVTTVATIACLTPLAVASAQAKHPITFADFSAVRVVSDPQPSPDGKFVLYAVTTTDVAANKRTSQTFIIPISGGTPQAFPGIDGPDIFATEARWSPDGKSIAYIANGQLWVSDSRGANRRELTHLNGGAAGPVWSPIGDRIAFTSAVYPACTTDACNAAKDKAAADDKVKAHIADQLMYRHWNAWDEGTRSHLFVIAVQSTQGVQGGEPRDLLPGARYDVPPGPFGGSEGYAWSPDGLEIAYTAKDQGRADATSTDLNVYTIPSAGGAPTVITAANKGGDQNPVYSPDGRFIAYSSQARAGFESDRERMMLYNRADRTTRELLPTWDRNADAYFFAPDEGALFIQTVDAGRTKLYRTIFERGTAGSSLLKPTTLQLMVSDHNNSSFALSRDGHTLVWLRDAAEFPGEVHTGNVTALAGVTAHALTHENDALVSQLAVNGAEDFWFAGANGARVQGFIVKPPNWQPGKKYPGILLVHGGPQGEWLDQWHSRWNYQMFAATGAALIIINPRGSFGYGQKFVDEVSKDWGGKAYVDLMDGVDAALAKDSWIDRNALGAAGGSYGGYMVDWIAGHTNRFKALVTHAGPFNLENMSVATEELWFPDWEYGGPYWDPKAMASQYRVYSPHLFVKNFKTPTLVTGGELDYRVPYTEDLAMFTALQRMNVPSRLVIFPDEGHWIGKPQNQQLWWGEVQGWLEKYLEGKPKA
ncbi:MAG TPA: S9 family peptidase [Gemmatimonadaceae bacterium]|jgi:dipeptidyl aminopeptidase/acylaminoacyl peptidase